MPAADAYLQKPWLRFYPGGVPANVEVPDKSVAQVFDEATERWADRAAVAFYGREVTYRELRDGADRLAPPPAPTGGRTGGRPPRAPPHTSPLSLRDFPPLPLAAHR